MHIIMGNNFHDIADAVALFHPNTNLIALVFKPIAWKISLHF